MKGDVWLCLLHSHFCLGPRAVRLLALAGGGEFDGGDDVDEFAEALLVEAGAGVVLGKDAFEARVVALEGDHGIVHDLADGGKFGRPLEVGPTGLGGHPEDVLGFVLLSASALPLRAACGRLSRSARLVGVFGIGPGVVALTGEELGAVFLEGVGDVFEEDEAEDDVLVFRRVHVVAELVGGEPELGLEADGGRGLGGSGGFGASHGRSFIACGIGCRGFHPTDFLPLKFRLSASGERHGSSA
jgi:hypothetical protein